MNRPRSPKGPQPRRDCDPLPHPTRTPLRVPRRSEGYARARGGERGWGWGVRSAGWRGPGWLSFPAPGRERRGRRDRKGPVRLRLPGWPGAESGFGPEPRGRRLEAASCAARGGRGRRTEPRPSVACRSIPWGGSARALQDTGVGVPAGSRGDRGGVQGAGTMGWRPRGPSPSTAQPALRGAGVRSQTPPNSTSSVWAAWPLPEPSLAAAPYAPPSPRFRAPSPASPTPACDEALGRGHPALPSLHPPILMDSVGAPPLAGSPSLPKKSPSQLLPEAHVLAWSLVTPPPPVPFRSGALDTASPAHSPPSRRLGRLAPALAAAAPRGRAPLGRGVGPARAAAPGAGGLVAQPSAGLAAEVGWWGSPARPASGSPHPSPGCCFPSSNHRPQRPLGPGRPCTRRTEPRPS